MLSSMLFLRYLKAFTRCFAIGNMSIICCLLSRSRGYKNTIRASNDGRRKRPHLPSAQPPPLLLSCIPHHIRPAPRRIMEIEVHGPLGHNHTTRRPDCHRDLVVHTWVGLRDGDDVAIDVEGDARL